MDYMIETDDVSKQLSLGETITFGTTSDCDFRIDGSSPKQGRLLAICARDTVIFYKKLTSRTLSPNYIKTPRVFRITSGKFELCKFRVRVSESDSLPSTPLLDEPVEDIEVGGEEVPTETTAQEKQEYGTRYDFDLTKLNRVTLEEVFGLDDLQRRAVGEILWKYLVKEVPPATSEPTNTWSDEWLRPIIIPQVSLDDSAGETEKLDFASLGWTWVNFSKVRSTRLIDAIHHTKGSANQIYDSLWSFIVKHDLIVRRTR